MVQVRLRDQHRGRSAAQPGDHFGEADRQRRRDALERLVEQQQPRADGQRARQRDQLLLPAGQEQRAPLAHLVQFGQHAVDEVEPGPFVQCARGPDRHQDVLFDGQLGHQPAVLGHVADAQRSAAVARHTGEVGAIEDDVPLRRLQVAHHGSKQRRLAGAVAPDEAGHAAAADLERQPAQHLHAADRDMERFDLQHEVTGAACRSRSAARRRWRARRPARHRQ